MNPKEEQPIDPYTELNKRIFASFSSTALAGAKQGEIYTNDLIPANDEKERLSRICIDLAIDDSAMDLGAGGEFPAGNAPKDFKTPYVAIEKDVYLWLPDEMVDTPYGFLPRAFDTTDGTAGYLLRNTYLISESGEAIKYYEVRDVGPDDEQEIRLDVVLSEENGYIPLKPGDYEFLGTVLEDIRSGRLR